ncbi:MAG: TonB-dependent receptor [Prolixibacteraceae bacterium]
MKKFKIFFQKKKTVAPLGKILKMMKVLTLIMLVAVVHVSAITYSQNTRLNLNVNNISIKEILTQLEEQTEFRFLYSDSRIDVGRKVSANINGNTIEEILSGIFKETDIQFKIIDRQILLSSSSDKPATMQQQRVTGKVVNEYRQALPGVTIIEKGTNNGSVTDVNGNYTVTNIPANAILVFSFIGMRTMEIEVLGRKVIDVVMKEETIGLEEVVAIGYGSVKRKDLTSSITTVSSEELNKGVIRDPVLALQGKVPGLNITKDGSPYGSASITLRGVSSLTLSGTPFYVVDGMPNALMPAIDDIVSIDVLKDASATAIYGSRAANGVIIITTKQGKSGKQLISYNSYVAVEKVSNSIDMMSASEYRKYLSDNGLALNPEDDMGVSTDWQDELTRVGISHKNNLSVSGGTDKTTYISSVEYYKNDGIIMGTSFDRINMRGSIEQYGFNDKLKLQFQIGGKIDKSDRLIDLEAVLRNMLMFQPTYAVYNDDGTYAERESTAPYNPVALIKQHEYQTKEKSIFGNIRADLHLMEGLDYTLNVSGNNGQSISSVYYSKYSRIDQGSNGYARRNAYENQSKALETYLTYKKKINNQNISLLAGYSWQEDVSGDGFQSTNFDFVSDDVLYYNLSLGSGNIPEYGTTTISTIRMISGYARLNYDLMDKYLLQATIRRDGSSAFGENVRWGTFPSASVGWRLMEESFIKKLNIFDNLKVRAGYGTSGNSAGFDPLSSLVRWGNGGSFYKKGEWITGITPVQNANPDLAWERTHMLNIGLDFAVLDGRISGTAEYYKKTTEGMIWQYTVPAEKYYVNWINANVGEMNNKGWEFSLDVIPVQTNHFTWNSSLIMSFNDNEVTSLSNDIFQREYIDIHGVGQHGQSGNYSHRIQEGYPMGQFCLWEYAGENESGISQFVLADGSLSINPSSLDRKMTKENAQPKATGGWSNIITYKSFTLDFLLRGVTGNHILNTTRADLNYPSEVTRYNLSKEAINEPVNNTRANYTSTRYLEKGDYIRLDNITLSYSPKISSPFLKRLTVYTTVNNAFLLTKYKGIDPEINMGGLYPGIDDRNFYPKTRSFIFGVRADL